MPQNNLYRGLQTVTLQTAAGSVLGTETVQYGAAGNILAKGAFTNYQYTHANRPHQVSAVTTPAGTRGYTYDANGNLTQVTGPGARTVSWWSFNKPRRMEKDGNNHAEYWYGPGGDRAMFRQSARVDGQTVLTLYGGHSTSAAMRARRSSTPTTSRPTAARWRPCTAPARVRPTPPATCTRITWAQWW